MWMTSRSAGCLRHDEDSVTRGLTGRLRRTHNQVDAGEGRWTATERLTGPSRRKPSDPHAWWRAVPARTPGSSRAVVPGSSRTWRARRVRRRCESSDPNLAGRSRRQPDASATLRLDESRRKTKPERGLRAPLAVERDDAGPARSV